MKILKIKKCIYLLIVILSFIGKTYGYQITFIPRITTSGEYTDNFYQTDTNQEDDLITTVMPGFTLGMEGKTSGLEVFYDSAYRRYRDHTESNYWGHDAGLTGSKEFSRNTKFEIQDIFQCDEELTTILRNRERHLKNTAIADVEYRFGEEDLIRFEHEYDINKYDETKSNNNESHSSSIDFEYEFTQHFGMETEASYTRRKYDETLEESDTWDGRIRFNQYFTRHLEVYIEYEHTDFKGEPYDYQVYNPSTGISYSVDEDTTLSLGVGYLKRKFDELEDESDILVEGQVDKTWRFSRGFINLTGASGYTNTNTDVSGAETLGYDVYYEAQCNAEYRFMRNLTGDISGSYRKDNYDDHSRKDDSIMAGTGLTYQALQWMFIGLHYSYESLESNSGEDFKENRGKISLTLVPSRPYRLLHN